MNKVEQKAMGNNLVIGNTSQLSYYFPEDYAKGKISVKDSHISYHNSTSNITVSVVYNTRSLCIC